MKIITSSNFTKEAKKKKKWKYNPFAVCTESTGREDKDKYERCIKSVKKKQSSTDVNIKEAKDETWIQDAIPESHKGKFGDWCRRKGHKGVTQECIVN